MKNIRHTNGKWVRSRRFLIILTAGICTGFIVAHALMISTGLDRLFFQKLCARYDSKMKKGQSNHVIGQMRKKTNRFDLAKKVRISCLIMLNKNNYRAKLQSIQTTWGARCKKLIFFSSWQDHLRLTIRLPITNYSFYQWGKLKAVFKYASLIDNNDADWFMKVDDETYVVIENLKFMLAGYKSSEKLYFENYEPKNNKTVYALSHGALKSFVNVGMKSPNSCRGKDSGDEDKEMGKCLRNLHFKKLHVDWVRRRRFVDRASRTPAMSVVEPYWANQQQYKNDVVQDSCSSHHIVFFHGVEAKRMALFEHFIYRLRPYGIH